MNSFDIESNGNRPRKTDLAMAKILGISRASYQLYRTHPDRLPEYPMLTALINSPVWEEVIGYLKGRVTKKELMKRVCELQKGMADGNEIN